MLCVPGPGHVRSGTPTDGAQGTCAQRRRPGLPQRLRPDHVQSSSPKAPHLAGGGRQSSELRCPQVTCRPSHSTSHDQAQCPSRRCQGSCEWTQEAGQAAGHQVPGWARGQGARHSQAPKQGRGHLPSSPTATSDHSHHSLSLGHWPGPWRVALPAPGHPTLWGRSQDSLCMMQSPRPRGHCHLCRPPGGRGWVMPHHTTCCPEHPHHALGSQRPRPGHRSQVPRCLRCPFPGQQAGSVGGLRRPAWESCSPLSSRALGQQAGPGQGPVT